MLLEDIADLPAEPERAVIINCSTRVVTTLALLSTLRHALMPVLLIDCESTDGSLAHFRSLMDRYDFDLLSAPLREHGDTLDWLFKHIPAERVLLVDSDTDILSPDIVRFFRDHIDPPTVFGCGFNNGPGWLDDAHFARSRILGALYCERMFMPLTLLKVAPVREALSQGKSFLAFRHDNEYSLLPPVAWLRAHSRIARLVLRIGPSWLRVNWHGVKPRVVYHDTGAQIYQFLRYEKMMGFAGLPERCHPRYLTHFFGTTRIALFGETHQGKDEGGGPAKIDAEARRRLRDLYAETVT
jgi:hypothetical protein